MNANQGIVLEIAGLNVGYGKRPVLRSVDLALRAGEILVVLGHNGAGKTTLLSTILGLLPSAGGRIDLLGNSIVGCSPTANIAAGIALVPQGHGVFPSMSVAENLEIAGASGQSGRAAINQSVIFELFPILKERQNQRAGTMSGGQQQMLAISMALKRQPRVLMLDEPSIGLAPNLVDRVLSAIQSVNRDFGISIMLVEQNATKALKIADHVVILKTGAKVYDGAPDVLKDQVALMTYF
jgi:branched-chain amino acid transport system ATP-binding protein